MDTLSYKIASKGTIFVLSSAATVASVLKFQPEAILTAPIAGMSANSIRRDLIDLSREGTSQQGEKIDNYLSNNK